MSKKVSIMDRICALEDENKQLQGLKRMFERAIKEEFDGLSVHEIHLIIDDWKKTALAKKSAEKVNAQPQQAAPARISQ